MTQMAEDHEVRLSVVERSFGEIKEAITSIRQSLEAFVRLEERHQETREGLNRAFKYCDSLEARIEAIEKIIPLLQQAKNLINGAVVLVLTSVLGALLYLVIR